MLHVCILTALCRKLVQVLHRSLKRFLKAGVTVPVLLAGVFALIFADFIHAYIADVLGFLVYFVDCWHFAVICSDVICLYSMDDC